MAIDIMIQSTKRWHHEKNHCQCTTAGRFLFTVQNATVAGSTQRMCYIQDAWQTGGALTSTASFFSPGEAVRNKNCRRRKTGIAIVARAANQTTTRKHKEISVAIVLCPADAAQRRPIEVGLAGLGLLAITVKVRRVVVTVVANQCAVGVLYRRACAPKCYDRRTRHTAGRAQDFHGIVDLVHPNGAWLLAILREFSPCQV